MGRRAAWAAVTVAAAIAAAGCAGPGAPAGTQVKLIALNDFHGHLESPGTFGTDLAVPPGQRPPVGGADALAAQVARLKAGRAHHVVVGAGDVIGASPLVSALFFDEPAVEVLNRIGLEFNAVGNHEFDHGAAELLRLQGGGCRMTGGRPDPNSCRGASVGTPVPFEGARFRWLSANVVATATGRSLLPAYGIKQFDGLPVAFIGMTLQATPTLVTPTGVAGLRFADEAQTVNALVPELRRQGIEAIVVLVHEGGVQTGARADINGCDGGLAGSPLAAIVARLDDAVDLVVSGHTHAAYNCRLPNARGRPIPVTSAGAYGRVLTDVDLTLDRGTRDVTAVQATNRLVLRNDPLPDPAVTALVDGYKRLAAPLANRVVGRIGTDLPNSRVDAACNMPAGNLVADAMLAATRPAGLGNARIALMNGGGVRGAGFTHASGTAGAGDGQVTYGEAFTVQPFGNSLVTMTLTARDLKDVLEQQFAGCQGQGATRLMLPSAGLRYTWDGAQACGARIRNLTLTADGTTETLVDAAGAVVDPARRLRVTVNSFMAAGGDGYTVFLRGTDPVGGPQDLDALIAYLGQFQVPAARASDSSRPRLQRLGGSICPTGTSTNP